MFKAKVWVKYTEFAFGESEREMIGNLSPSFAFDDRSIWRIRPSEIEQVGSRCWRLTLYAEVSSNDWHRVKSNSNLKDIFEQTRERDLLKKTMPVPKLKPDERGLFKTCRSCAYYSFPIHFRDIFCAVNPGGFPDKAEKCLDFKEK
jgi:hypothetical protein